jgi:hypothetical protein
MEPGENTADELESDVRIAGRFTGSKRMRLPRAPSEPFMCLNSASTAKAMPSPESKSNNLRQVVETEHCKAG